MRDDVRDGERVVAAAIGRRAVLLGAAFAMVACGGGGGGSGGDTSTTPPPPPPPPPPSPPPVWGSALEVRPASFGRSSAAMLADGSVLVLTDVLGVEPSQLSVVRIGVDRTLSEPITVTSLSTRGDVGRAPFYQTAVTATTSDGAFIAWREYIPNGRNSGELERLQVCRYRPLSGLQEPALIRALPTGSVFSYSMAALPQDGAVMAWIESLPDDPDSGPGGPMSLYVATYSEPQGWSAATRLITTTPEQPIVLNDVTVGTSTQGHVVVLWSQEKRVGWGDTLMATTRSPQGQWGSPSLVYETNDSERAESYALGVAVDGLGNAIAIWEHKSWDGKVHRSAFNRMNASAGWLGAVDISQFAVEPRIVVNTAGSGLLVWGDDGFVYGAAFDTAGFGNATAISLDRAVPAGAAVNPLVSIGEDGYGMAAWDQVVYDHGEHTAVRGARFAPTSGWSSVSSISPTKEIAVISSITNTLAGRVAVVWNQGDISGGNSSFWLMPILTVDGR